MYKMTMAAIIWLLCAGVMTLGVGWAQEKAAPDAKAQGHGHDHQHSDHDLAPAPSTIQMSPEQIEYIRQKRIQAWAEAKKAYAAMALEPGLGRLKLGFDDRGQVFKLGMDLERAVTAILAGGNRCRVKSPSPGHEDCTLEIITKDKRILSFEATPKDPYLLIGKLTMAKLEGGPFLRQQGPKAAFYLMTFMRGL
ncbi:MAG: hypothetical protein KJ720_14455 [Proteobacteria bacterium]|nr:hypothetical protein [Pseudomonadota bacterium]MBU1449907.1 hypothetical protein [Pseudomonadota bacterium]MBU2467001.1 hypothetical protein [Pseudomonadota bacterium]MBU2516752.1 hypothetical protein [Pseudomonadota bacterium]